MKLAENNIIGATRHKGWERISRKGWVRAVVWSPDGKNVCTESDDIVQVWNLAEKRVKGAIHHQGEAVAWSPDGKNLCTGSFNHTAEVWNVAEKKIIGTIQHRSGIRTISWSPDGR